VRSHVVFQTSSIDALLDGAYDGELTFAELAAHGDLGLGTVAQLDGEMIALGRRFYRADADGRVSEIDARTKTPFAVVIPFAPTVQEEVDGPLDLAGLASQIDRLVPEASSPCVALRLDGRFPWLHLRSVRREEPPYRPLAEVLADQVEHELGNAVGTLVGFRFPDQVQGIEVAGYHLHFVTADRASGGHVLDLRVESGRIALDGSSELHLEVPAGLRLPEPDTSVAKHDLIDSLESGE
jgi:acetolactate decarboxylase